MENEDGEIESVDGALASCPGPSAPSEAVVVNRQRRWHFREPKLEVFSVRYMNSNGQSEAHLYGEIKVYDSLDFCQHIYNRDWEHSESIRPGDTALLTGPAKCVRAFDMFTIVVGLVYEYNNQILGDEIITLTLDWTFHNFKKYNTPLSKEARGLFGWVIVNYAVFGDAVAATVEVSLINGDNKNPAKLYGKLTARNSDFLDESFESALFRKTLDEDIDVSPGQPIPLSRSLIIVPWNSSLIVEANLLDSLDDHEIAKGTAEFSTQPDGTSEDNISGKYGEIRVKVTWDHKGWS